MSTVAMIGCGKLGLPTAVAMAEKGHIVIGYDIDKELIEKYKSGKAGLYEPAIDEKLKMQLDAGKLMFTTELSDAINGAEIIFIAVQTPHPKELDGSVRFNHARKDFDYSYLIKSCRDIAKIVDNCEEYKLLVIVSTVLPGTTDELIYPEMQKHIKPIGHHWSLIYNPAFIAMGTVIHDYVDPEFTLIGEHHRNSEAGDIIERFYRTIHDKPIMRMKWAEAEGVKVWYNTFITFKITYANMIMQLCDKLNANCDVVANALTKATDRLISPKYLFAGNQDGGGCLKPEELVYTSTGLQPIANISVGGMVIGHDGRYHKVTKTYRRPYNGKLYRVYPEGFSGFPIVATPSHPVWSGKRHCNGEKYRLIAQPNRSPKRLGFMTGHEPLDFTEISKIEHGDVIGFPTFKENGKSLTITLPVNKYDRRRDSLNPTLPSVFSMENDIMYFFGLYIAEGNTWKREIQFSFHSREESSYAAEIIKTSKEHFQVKAKVKRRKGSGITVKMTNAPLARYLRETFGAHSYEKKIPWDWIQLPDEKLKYLLKGIWDGDGGFYKKEHYLQTTSKELTDFIKIALLKLKMPYRTKIYKARVGSDGTKHRKSYWIAIRENMFSVEPVSKKKTIWFEGDTMLCHVKKVETEDYIGDVCNLEVDDANSYMLEGGVVHNCHPRDNMALAHISEKYGLDYNLFDFIMTVREKQIEWFADNIQKYMQSPDQQVVIMGKTFKKDTNLTVGSPSVLLWNILQERGIEATFYDPETDNLLPERRPSIFFVGTNWPQFKTFDYCANSTVIDPWGIIKDVPSDVKLVSLGRAVK